MRDGIQLSSCFCCLSNVQLGVWCLMLSHRYLMDPFICGTAEWQRWCHLIAFWNKGDERGRPAWKRQLLKGERATIIPLSFHAGLSFLLTIFYQLLRAGEEDLCGCKNCFKIWCCGEAGTAEWPTSSRSFCTKRCSKLIKAAWCNELFKLA